MGLHSHLVAMLRWYNCVTSYVFVFTILICNELYQCRFVRAIYRFILMLETVMTMLLVRSGFCASKHGMTSQRLGVSHQALLGDLCNSKTTAQTTTGS